MLATGVHAHRNTLSFLALLDQSVDSFGVMPLHAEKEHIEKCIGSLHTVYIRFTYPQCAFGAQASRLMVQFVWKMILPLVADADVRLPLYPYLPKNT